MIINLSKYDHTKITSLSFMQESMVAMIENKNFNAYLKDITGYRKTEMKGMLTRERIDQLRKYYDLDTSVMRAREEVLSLIDTIPAFKGCSTEKVFDKLVMYGQYHVKVRGEGIDVKEFLLIYDRSSSFEKEQKETNPNPNPNPNPRIEQVD